MSPTPADASAALLRRENDFDPQGTPRADAHFIMGVPPLPPRAKMRTISHAEGGGGGPQPVAAPRVRHPARHALIFLLLILMALAWGTLVAAAWDALSDMRRAAKWIRPGDEAGEVGNGQSGL